MAHGTRRNDNSGGKRRARPIGAVAAGRLSPIREGSTAAGRSARGPRGTRLAALSPVRGRDYFRTVLASQREKPRQIVTRAFVCASFSRALPYPITVIINNRLSLLFHAKSITKVLIQLKHGCLLYARPLLSQQRCLLSIPAKAESFR